MSSTTSSNDQFCDPSFQYSSWLSSPPPGDEVVISGMSGRLPESNTIQEYMDNLYSKTEMISPNDKRWTCKNYEIPPRFGKVKELNKFDAGYFGVHHTQADIMDPMMRMVMEVAVESIVDAGVNPLELAGTRTGVFASTSWTDTSSEMFSSVHEGKVQFLAAGTFRSFYAQRLSYFLKVKGPAFNSDTACSSSLNSFDVAFRAIRSGQCDNALVVGSNLVLHPGSSIQFFRLGVLSSDAVCRVFDQDANGYVRGEAIACVFLQKAKNSKRIYAQIINIKGNSDGYKPEGITYPSMEAQKMLMNEIHEECKINPSEISFIEAHGTGTQAGDPQEVEAIDNALAKKRSKELLVGSVKCSIGHTEPASGLCSIIKVLLAMEKGFISPNINITKIKNNLTGILEGRMKLVTEVTELKPDDAIVAINNFGFGGSNVHMLLRRFKKGKINNGEPDDDVPRLVCVTGRTEESVIKILNNLTSRPLDGEYVALLHQIFKINDENHLYRGYTILSKHGPIKSSTFLTRRIPLYVVFRPFENNFELLAKYFLNFTSLKTTISSINDVLVRQKQETFESLSNKSLKQDLNILGSICVQLVLVNVIKLLDIQPTAVYGDSYGKIAAAYYNNVISLEDAVTQGIKLIQSDEDLGSVFVKKFNENSFLDPVIPETANVFILNVSDSHLNGRDVLLVENNNVEFLEILGRLYQRGQTMQLHKLYPEIELPVSRGTSMISPLIQWDHRRKWHAFQFFDFTSTDAVQKEHFLSCLNEENKYLTGHVIDGRNLFPATGYLHLVWQTLAKSKKLLTDDLPVIFKNCKFIRSITLTTAKDTPLLITVQTGSGYFEILERNEIVASGFIESLTDVGQQKADFDPLPCDFDDRTKILDHDEIYRELYLRGYNYSGMFKGIENCNSDASAALIKWENNWVSFMDNMLQMMLLQTDTKLLFVPTGIQKLIIDPSKHLQMAERLPEDEPLFPVYTYKDSNLISSGGIEISGLQSKSIAKKKQRLEPVLERNEFVPNHSLLNLSEAIRVDTQIILEINLAVQFKAVEIIDDFTDFDAEYVLPFVSRALDDVPMIVPDLTISSRISIEEDFIGVKIGNVTLTAESNLNLLVGAKLFSRLQILEQMSNSLAKNGFILTREEIDFIPEEISNFEILTEYVTPNEKLILLQKTQQVDNFEFIQISSDEYSWLTKLQKSIENNSTAVIYAKNEKPEGILGLVNCIRREPNGHKVRCLFMMDDAPEFDSNNSFYSAQLRKGFALNVYKNRSWGTYRHLRLEEAPKVESEHYFANVANRGDLSSFKWIEAGLSENTPLKEDQLLVYPYYSAVNFKDIMTASGRLNVENVTMNRLSQECPLGFEFAGKDSRGRRVFGMTSARSLASHVVAAKNFLWQVPEGWSLEEAATVPVVYSTVLYAFSLLKEIKPSTSILIHSGTGGIGLAALNVCLHYKCEIFVTVGTQEKREYLKKHYPQIPENHIGNSRDISFEEMIKKETKRRGVDIVLNSLSDDKLKASLRCLAPGGSFLEIGKFDLANDTEFHLLLMDKEASYHGVMLDQILHSTDDGKANLIRIINNGIALGYIKPLPMTVFDKEEVEAAYRYMMTGKHIGKVLVKIRDEAMTQIVPFAVNPSFNCDARCSYVIIGGLGGVGLELADWLVLRNAKKIVLVSRTGLQSGYQLQRIRIWKSYGVDVHISTDDVTTKKGCVDLITNANKLGPLDAIFNLAVVLKDALFEDQTKEMFEASQAPKAQATIFLDEITRKLCPNLRYFVVFSSVSCGRGNAGQSNYGMANSIMERVCENRRKEGFPGVAIQWGAIGDVGLVAKMQKENKELIIGGTLQQKISSCLQALDTLLRQPHPVVSCMVVAEKHHKNHGNLSVVDTIATLLGINCKIVSHHSSLAELGMDSMTTTEVIQALEKDFDIYLTTKDVRNLTISKLMELETENNETARDSTITKTQLAADMLIQHIPDSSTCHLPIVRLDSELQENEEGSTVFLLPGVDGVFKGFESFAKKLKAHVFGLQYNYDNPEDTIEETAENILENIRKMLPKKRSFFIICYSYGATVGLELATLLEEKGHSGQLICIEGSPTYIKRAAKSYIFGPEDFDLKSALLLRIMGMMLPLELVSQHKDKILKCASIEEGAELLISLIPIQAQNKLKLEKQTAIALYKRLEAVINYEFNQEKITSQVHLLKARCNILDEDGEDYELSSICEQPVEVTTLDGDHVTILDQPELVHYVNQLIDNL